MTSPYIPKGNRKQARGAQCWCYRCGSEHCRGEPHKEVQSISRARRKRPSGEGKWG